MIVIFSAIYAKRCKLCKTCKTCKRQELVGGRCTKTLLLHFEHFCLSGLDGMSKRLVWES